MIGCTIRDGEDKVTIELPTDIAQFVNEQLAAGRYMSAEEVLRDAVQSLKRFRAEVDAIQEGFDDLKAGRYPSFEDADPEIRRPHNLPPAP